MKKILALLVSLMMILSLAVTAFAAEMTTFTVETVSETHKAGDEVTVNITVSGNTGIAGMAFVIDYDKTQLQLVDFEDTQNLKWEVGIEGVTVNGASFGSSKNFTGNGVIMKLKFKVLSGAEGGFVKINLTEAEAFDADEAAVPFSIVSGGITVKGVCKHVNTEVRNEKAATCAAEGYTGDTYCKDCKELVKKGEATPKNPQNHISETEIKNEKKATCGEKGYTGDVYCKGCGIKLANGEETEIDPNNHKFGEWKVVKEATKDAEGVKERTCSICNKVETVKIPRLSDNTEPIHISANGESKGEKNPNTGAESAIGVVALAAVCTGAYIVGKKHR